MGLELTQEQHQISTFSGKASVFLEGQAMTGKTTVGTARLSHLIQNGVPPESILVLTPQRTLAEPYYRILQDPNLPAGSAVNMMTLGGLAQRLIKLFWPIIASEAGFKNIEKLPAFLTLESAQYYLASIVFPLIEDGYFENINIDPNRILSQIIDNLNKSAVTGIPIETISARLKSAWIGKPSNFIVYDQAQECALLFRQYCLDNNLLDYSLQISLFSRYLKPSALVNQYLLSRIKHLIFDNIEEDTPIAHETVFSWLPELESALLIYDQNGGYRAFLGADSQSGQTLKKQCTLSYELTQPFIPSPSLINFSHLLSRSIDHRFDKNVSAKEVHSAYSILGFRYYPEMVEGVVNTIANLVNNGTSPSEIAVLSPFLSDSLRFSLVNRLEKLGIPARSHRPSRSLREEPSVQCLINWAKLAHPQWKYPLSQSDLRYTLHQSIQGIDIIRADLLASITYRETRMAEGLSSFDLIRPDMQERITHTYGQSFEVIRNWLNLYKLNPLAELDIFFSRIFGELLSQPGFGFHENYDTASNAALLIESTQKFRRDTNNLVLNDEPLGKTYIRLVEEGLVAAQYLQNWQDQPEDAIFLSPAYTFLMNNKPVSYQFWLDTSSQGWWERLQQPLTHPYVLSRSWPDGAPWTDTHEFTTNQANLSRLIQGLTHRCREHIFLVTTTFSEQGDEQKGPLLQAIQVLLRHTRENQD